MLVWSGFKPRPIVFFSPEVLIILNIFNLIIGVQNTKIEPIDCELLYNISTAALVYI